MKNRTLNYTLIFLSIISVYACNIVSLDESTSTIDNLQSITIVNNFPLNSASLNTILTNQSTKSWTVTGFTIGGSNTFQNCRLGDKIVLNSNGSYSYDGGSQLCGAEDNKKIKSGSWEADFDNRILYFDRGTINEIEVYIETCESSKVIISTRYFGMAILGQFEI